MATFLQDLKFALRNLRQAPGFTLAAIGTLALGIGATTAIFSTVNAALLKPLPFPNPDELYGLRTHLTDGRITTGMLSAVEVRRLLGHDDLPITHAAGVLPQDVTLLREDGTPLRTRVYGVTEGFFELFGLPLALGSGFTPEDYADGDAAPRVVISHRIWQDMFGGAPDIIGKTIRFAELPTVVVGVASRDFDTPRDADFWFGLRLGPQDMNHFLEGYMRVAKGANMTQVVDQMNAIMRDIARELPGASDNRIYIVKPLVEQIVGDLKAILIVVLSATGLLLVLACVNVTNLLLARGTTRLREMALRVALGAGRGRILRQLLTESAVLAAGGALVGLGLAYASVQFLLAAGASRLPRLDAVPFDLNVLLFAVAVMLVCGVVVGFAPAIRLAGTDLRLLMNESSRSSSGGPGTVRWLSGLMVAEIALAVTLVAGAGWLVQSFDNLQSADLGFSGERRLWFEVTLNGPQFNAPEAVDTTVQDLKSRLAALPSVRGVATTTNVPLAGSQENSLFIQFRGEAHDPANALGARQRLVSPGFFELMGIPLRSGRDFTDADRFGGENVAVVNQTFVDRYLGGRDPIGVRFSSGYPQINPQSEATIIGVVGDVRQRSVSVPGEAAFYSSDRQLPAGRRQFVIETASTDTAALSNAIRDEVRRTDPQLAIQVQDVSTMVAATLERQQLGTQLMTVFGIVALLLAAVGIYGVIAYVASQRRTEVATRLALGASAGDVFKLMLRQGQTLALVGAIGGLGIAYLAGRFVTSRLSEVSASDPWILGAATFGVALLAFAATAIPAFRSSRVNPVEALRPKA